MKDIVDVEKLKRRKLRMTKAWNVISFTFVIIFVIAACAFSIPTIVVKTLYQPFWVNGISMQPTLNGDAHYQDGTKIGDLNSGRSLNGAYNLDYGYMDTREKTIDTIERFDIVITKYKDTDSSDKIKRIIGLPGETIKIINTGEEKGDLYVMNADGDFDYVAQPETIKDLRVPTNYPYNPITLGEDEYYVMGDNRTHSNDSRNLKDPITRHMIVGKVVFLVGTCSIKNVNGVDEVDKITYSLPRSI